MKSIELTTLHRVMLREMIVALFPQYSVNVDGEQILLGNGIDKKPTITFHWFEFCLMHLVPKIEKDYISFLYLSDVTRPFYGGEDVHIVDNLYSKFKRLPNG